MGAFYKLRLLTAQCGGEVSAMRWDDMDLAAGWWTIPADTSKDKLAHRVPLTEGAATFTAADFRGHDLRGTAASIMASGGIPGSPS